MNISELEKHIDLNIQGNIELAWENLLYAYNSAYSPDVRNSLRIVIDIVSKMYENYPAIEASYIKRTASKDDIVGTSFKPRKKLTTPTNSNAPLIEQGRGRNAHR